MSDEQDPALNLSLFGEPPSPPHAPASDGDGPALIETVDPRTGQVALLPPTWQEAHWQGLPEFVQKAQEPFKSILVHFRTEGAMLEFQQVIGQRFKFRAPFIWYPEEKWWDNTSTGLGWVARPEAESLFERLRREVGETETPEPSGVWPRRVKHELGDGLCEVCKRGTLRRAQFGPKELPIWCHERCQDAYQQRRGTKP